MNEIYSLKARYLSKKTGPLKLLDQVSFSAGQSELIGIIGPSGAGKSTFMKALCGFQPADQGKVLINHQELYETFDQFRQQIGYVPQDDIIHPSLNVFKTLKYAGLLRLPPGKDAQHIDGKVSAVMAQLELTERKHVQVKKLSGGQRKRVSIGVELMTSPELLFLDEPTSGLDPGLEEKTMHLLKNLAKEGRIICVTTHVMKSLQLLDKLLVLIQGKLAYYGPPDKICSYFEVESFSDVFHRLTKKSASEWMRQFSVSPYFSQYV